MSHGDHVERRRRVRRHGVERQQSRSRRCATRASRSTACSFIPRWRTRRAAGRSSPTSSSRSATRSRRGRRAPSSRGSASASATTGRRSARVICGLSGGVDSSVAAALVHRAIGDQLTCIFVDTGLLRLHEREQVERTFRANLGIKLVTDRRGGALPRRAARESRSRRRSGRIIGHTFIDVFEDAAARGGEGRRFPGAGDALSGRDRVASRRAAVRR